MEEVRAWTKSISSLSDSEFSPPLRSKRARRCTSHHRRVRPRLDISAQASSHISSSMDSATDASSILSLDSRRRLKATSPLMKRKGSQSPERTQRVLLEQGKPPIRIRQPDSTSRIASSEELQGILSDDFSDCFIPEYFRERLRQADPVVFRNDIRSHMFERPNETELDQATTEKLESLWRRVQRIHTRAKRCNNNNKDENAWARVVWEVLEAVVENDDVACLEINSVQSQSIHPDYLSIDISGLAVSKKADFVLAFCGDDNENISKVYENFRSDNKGATLSPMTDAYTSGTALACAIELKEAGGKATEAEMQLAVYHAAMLWKIRELVNMRRERPMEEKEIESLVPSVLGWTVIGHKWSLYISSLLPDNSIMCQGPFDGLHTSTSTRHGILLLFNLLRRVTAVASDMLWPAMQEILGKGEVRGWRHHFREATANIS
ncbi:unnamed protein product [Periconia digitata]|uniref:PD-(D/E)XK nuclease-like domain-containing protein n=1 Tax=Periconia digitata TaxID=1303443 RepID=A0A9W4UIV2_9PLEO|nr:unnamed protein product [Periconia digitata]